MGLVLFFRIPKNYPLGAFWEVTLTPKLTNFYYFLAGKA
ncbi:hypothetical protein C943_03585 [Mariniradius saccharolyticus AK6]|uniref:Uncharacterized protein n=1 Tax=Mariniradius saccharolyticus AK6 TaxID=1239962 RepID=M7YB34_9BACT|nr:hypothetical protein C943_03585 [Mariniradius saccharolyticus AK6]